MAAMYQHQGPPLQAYNRTGTFCRPYSRSAINAKRKSAVELLEETKCLYVKSGTVLDSKQELMKAQQQQQHQHHQLQHVPTHHHHQHHPSSSSLNQLQIQPQQLTCAGKMAAVPQRRSNNSVGSSDQLQTKLRRLLNADSKENLADIENLDGMKNNLEGRENSGSRHNCRSLPDLTIAFSKEPYSVFTPSSSKKNGSGSSSKHEEMSISKSKDTDETDSESSSDKSYGQPPSPVKSSVSFGGSATKAEIRRKRTVVEWEGVEVSRLCRSKSEMGSGLMSGSGGSGFERDLGAAAAAAAAAIIIHQSQPLPQHLNDFFQYLGLTSAQYSALTEEGVVDGSRCSSPVFFSSSSSVGSSSTGRRRRTMPASSAVSTDSDTPAVPPPPPPSSSHLLPSIVERNARVIKWLCHCTSVVPVRTHGFWSIILVLYGLIASKKNLVLRKLIVLY